MDIYDGLTWKEGRVRDHENLPCLFYLTDAQGKAHGLVQRKGNEWECLYWGKNRTNDEKHKCGTSFNLLNAMHEVELARRDALNKPYKLELDLELDAVAYDGRPENLSSDITLHGDRNLTVAIAGLRSVLPPTHEGSPKFRLTLERVLD